VDDVLNGIQKFVVEAMSDVNKSNTVVVVQALDCIRHTVLYSRSDIHHSCARLRHRVSGASLFDA